MSELVINYKTDGGHGTMRLILDNCLPCEPSWLKKVLRVVHMADNSEELEAELLLYLNKLFDNLEDPAEYEAKRRNYEHSAGLCKSQVDILTGQEKAQAQYVKLHVKRGDKENTYRKQLEKTREELKSAREHFRSFSAKASACKRTLEDRARSERRIRECLKLLGQEEAECQQVTS